MANPNPTTPPPEGCLTAIERLERVREGVIAGKAWRQMARELNCDEGTIRRDVKKLNLSAEQLEMLLNGAKAEPLLRDHRQKKKQMAIKRKAETIARQRQLLLEEEARNGVLSEQLFLSIMKFLAQFPLWPADLLRILRVVEMRSWFEGDLREPAQYPDHEVAIAVTSPMSVGQETYDIMTNVGNWLYRWLLKTEPKRAIRDSSLTKVRQNFEKQCRWVV